MIAGAPRTLNLQPATSVPSTTKRRGRPVLAERAPIERLPGLVARIAEARAELSQLEQELMVLSVEAAVARAGLPSVSQWLSAKDVAKLLGISESQVHQLRENGVLPAIRPEGLERRWVWDVSTIERYQRESRAC